MRARAVAVSAVMATAALVGFGPCDPPSGCASSTQVDIATGANAQTVINGHGAGTVYRVKAGTHQSNFAVVPKAGDFYCGEAGAVLDGGMTRVNAFSGSAVGVTLDSLTVRNYATGFQGAAIQPATHAGGWVVRNVTASGNYWAGLMATDNMLVVGGHYNDNGQLGISGNSSTGVVVDGAEIGNNHVLHADCQYEGGGMKWDEGYVTIRNANVHDNACRGLWADINAKGLVENNRVTNNASEGIVFEISQDATIRNNVVVGNGNNYPPGNGWYWNSGILAAASFNVEVYGNRLSGNYNGITGVQQTRNDSTPPAHLLDHFHVYNNQICATGAGGHPTGVIADNGANLAIRDITFTNNTVQSAACP